MARFQLSPQVVAQASKLGLSEGRLQRLVDLSAPYTDPHFNRRNQEYLFLVEKGVLGSMGCLETEQIMEDPSARYSPEYP